MAEFEKSEYTSSNEKVEFYFNQIIIKCYVESWQMFKMLSIDSFFLRENQNQNPILIRQNSLWNCPKSNILHFGTKAHSELPWVFPECLFCTSGLCLTHFIPRSASPGMCCSISFWVPFPWHLGWDWDIRLSQHELKSWEDCTVQISLWLVLHKYGCTVFDL